MRPNYFWKSIHIIRKINNNTLKLFQTIRMLIMVKIILVIIEISRPPRGQFCRVMVHQYDLWRPRKASQPFGPAPQQINQIQQIINRKISLWADTKAIFGQEQIVIQKGLRQSENNQVHLACQPTWDQNMHQEKKKMPMVNFLIFVHKNVYRIRFQEIKIRP